MLHPSLDTLYTRFFFRDRPFFLFITGSAILWLAFWPFLIFGIDTFRPSDTDYITLHYKMTVGTDFLARWESIFFIPALALFVIVCNTLVARAVIHASRPFARALALTAFGATAVLFFGLYTLYRVNQ